jgi:hypothetical protein
MIIAADFRPEPSFYLGFGHLHLTGVVCQQYVEKTGQTLFTIEVKSRLTNAELASANEAARELRQMNYIPRPLGGKITRLISCVFAFSTDLVAGSSEIDRYTRLEATMPPPLLALCVVGRGYWFWGNGQNWEQGSIAAVGYPYAEMIDLVSSILQTYDGVSKTRSTNINPYFRPL